MAVKMQDEYGDSLNVVFVESQNHGLDDIERLALQRKWFGTSAMWTTERPVVTGARGLPNFVLLSSEGEVVLMGNPLSMHSQVEEHLEKFVKARARPPKTLPKPLHDAWKDAARGKLGAAWSSANRVAERAENDAGLAEAAAALVSEIDATAQRELARIDRAIEDGFYAFAGDRLKQLAKDYKGSELAARVDDRVARLEADDLATAIDAERALQRIEKKLYGSGASAGSKKQLSRLADKYPDTIAAARATRLATLLD